MSFAPYGVGEICYPFETTQEARVSVSYAHRITVPVEQ